MTDQYSGEANRNIGDAFLITWPLPDNIDKSFTDIQK